MNVDSAGNSSAHTETKSPETLPADEMKDRVQELVDYRDAGVLSDAELEEQKTRLHWGITGHPA